MRTYAPAAPEVVLTQLLAEPSLARGVAHHAVLPARVAEYGTFPPWLDRRIVAGLAQRGVERPYTHQAEAFDMTRNRHDTVVVTPTASGKSLCYSVPILQAIAEDPSARALLLFPTKALGQDQVAEFAELATASGLPVSASTYDGDTPAPIRAAIRSAGQVVVTNPDMLHAAILPHHTKWFQLFEQLRYIVIDELHTYRGVFGGHVANVIRRLLRICAHYGSHPIIVCCSATIGNPGELAESLIGRPVRIVDRNGAPAGERHLLLVDPPLLDPATGAKGSATTLAQRWALPFLRAGRQTIVFGRSRVAVELLLTGLRESLRESRGPRSRLRGYRGGYLPTERRAIERGLQGWRDPRRGGDQRPRTRRRHRAVGCCRRGRLPRVDRGHVAAVRTSRPAGGNEHRHPGRDRGARGPVHRPPPGIPARREPRGGPGRPGQPARPPGASPGGRLRAAVRAGRTVRAGSSR